MRTMDLPVVRAGQPLPPGMENIPNLVTPEAVQITPTYPELPGEEQKLIVEAGGHAHLPTLVRNQSGIVDNYEIQVKGMPDEWWNVSPPSVYLVPFGAPSGTYEQDVQINFTPPRSAEAEARIWQLEVVAVSRAQGEVAGSTKIQVQITPYEQIESELRPELVTGRRRGEFALMVRNRANAPLDIVITAVDTQNALAFDFAKAELHRRARPARRHDLHGQGEEAPLDRSPQRQALRDVRARRHRRDAAESADRGLPPEAVDPLLGADRDPRAHRGRCADLLADPAQDDRAEPARAERYRGRRHPAEGPPEGAEPALQGGAVQPHPRGLRGQPVAQGRLARQERHRRDVHGRRATRPEPARPDPGSGEDHARSRRACCSARRSGPRSRRRSPG